jgi:peptidoglycan/LPS O-acetylase OafA/YrhL
VANPANTGWSASHSRTRWLDGLRGLAALFVVLHHMWLASWPFFPQDRGPWYLGWLLYGHLAVAVFIVVSGYSLTLAPVRHGGTLNGGMKRFLRRRAWRILPAYWAALVLSTVAFATFLHPDVGSATTGKSFAIHAVLLQDVFGNVPVNGTFWSIAVEWQIYFVFPLILVLARRTSIRAAVATTVVAVLIAHVLSVSGGALLAKIGHLSPQFLALFAMGVLAAWTANSEQPRAGRRLVTATTLAAFAAVVTLALTKGSPWMTAHWFSVDILFGTAVAGALLLTAQTDRGWRNATLGSRPIVFLGTFSYSLYLVHAPVLETMQRFVIAPLGVGGLADFALLMVFVLPAVLLAAYGFFRLFERPFLDRRDLASLRTLPLWQLLTARRGALRATPAVQEEPA